ncbi:hypothetical protein [Halorarius halobius]|uniref:hypothetical protein n=1 Tax=Halorarius halobius TaxID=2962671 RepID=UPI0020CF1FA9|nr:hypothetical protein [Halorarius halobius]
MAVSPHLVRERDELRLNASVDGTRRDLVLSDRAESLLVDDLEYAKADLVPFVTVKALVLAGGASVPEGMDARDAAWGLAGADGGAEASDEELYRVAEYLRAVDVEDRAVETLREHVSQTGLSRFITDEEIESKATRVGGLSDIARDL